MYSIFIYTQLIWPIYFIRDHDHDQHIYFSVRYFLEFKISPTPC